jgi:hypothetical protein
MCLLRPSSGRDGMKTDRQAAAQHCPEALGYLKLLAVFSTASLDKLLVPQLVKKFSEGSLPPVQSTVEVRTYQ